MSLKKSLQKTKTFILKTLHNLRSILFGRGYQKIPRTLIINPLSCSSTTTQRTHHPDPDDHHINQANPHRPIIKQPTSNTPTTIDVANQQPQSMAKNPPRKLDPATSSSSCSSFTSSRRFQKRVSQSYILPQKMKELEMMDLSDVDHSLDVEEALHYYSRLTCPVYVDIVNNFFMDMYAEFLIPQPSNSITTTTTINSSSRRLGPISL